MLVSTRSQHWDIFCTVVDNYGDIGVTWRLARQLAAEYQLEIHLWVDDLNSFQHILPTLDTTLSKQTFFEVTIHHWHEDHLHHWQAGAVLIEAFACNLPPSIEQQLQHAFQTMQPVPLWLNLEYLSAEDWVEGCHGLPSMLPTGLTKYFYMPGFTAKTGGLICEQNLFAERDRWQADPQHKFELFKQLGLQGVSPTELHANDKIISAFSYETTALAELCELWRRQAHHTHLLLPLGRSLNSLTDYLPLPLNEQPLNALRAGQCFTFDNLSLHILPMTNQQDYDKLLWSCDLNIVRGEDSFLRAQWAGKPFIWHIYPQEEDYHLVKLAAFSKLYCNNLTDDLAQAWTELVLGFNQQACEKLAENWLILENSMQQLDKHAKVWAIDAINDTDLAFRLVQFIKTR